MGLTTTPPGHAHGMATPLQGGNGKGAALEIPPLRGARGCWVPHEHMLVHELGLNPTLISISMFPSNLAPSSSTKLEKNLIF